MTLGEYQRFAGDRMCTFAFARTDGGITLSGPKACRGSTNDVKILPHFLHSAEYVSYLDGMRKLE
jgi:hypothetical protein